MNHWTRVNLLLAVLAVSLLILQLWPAGSADLKTLTMLGETEIAQVRVEQADRLQLALQRDADGWRLTHPHDALADSRRVQQLLAIAQAPVQDEFRADGALARYGLDQPSAVLQLNQLRLLFGDRDPGQTSRYVLIEDTILVIDDVYFNLLSLPASHFIGG